MPDARVQLTLTSQVAPQIAATANAYKSLAAEEQKAEQAATRYAAALTRVALADAKTATEEQRLAVQTANAARAQTQAEQAALRLSVAQEKAAAGSNYASQTAGAFGSQLTGMIGPVASATAGIGALIATANSFKEAFAFKAQLDSTTQAITTQLRGVRDSGQVFNEANAFADRYKIIQSEITSTIQASIGVMRNSRSSTTDLLTQLSLLQATTPDKPISEAARALRELSTGDATTIKEVFNVSAGDALKMKNEIAAGGDAVQVLARYLKDSGASMDLLDQRAQGAAGAMRDLAKAQEDVTIAQGQIATSKVGIAVVNETSTVYRGLANLLNGDVTSGIQAHAQNMAFATVRALAYYSAIRDGKTALEANLIAQQAVNDAVLAIADPAETGAGAYTAAAQAAQYYAGRLDTLTHFANTATSALNQLNRVPPPHLTDTSAQGGAIGGLGDRLTKAGNLAAQAAKKTDAEAARLQDARDSLALSRAKTSAQKIAELQRQQAASDDPVKRLQLQQQIEQEQQGTAKAHTSELTKQLTVHESIADSLNKQRDAQLDIEELLIRDRQQDRDDAQKAKTARAILASPNANADLKARAQDALDLISVQDRKRAAEIASKGGPAFTGAVGGPLPPSGGNAPLGPLPSAGGPSGAAAADAVGPITINLVVDGKTLASVSEPYIMDALLKAVRGARASAGV